MWDGWMDGWMDMFHCTACIHMFAYISGRPYINMHFLHTKPTVPISQVVPVYPTLHSHLYDPISSIQVPPYLQSPLWQSCSSGKHEKSAIVYSVKSKFV